MAKDVQFNIKLQLDGKEQIATVSTNVKELAEQLGVANKSTLRLRDSFFAFNQVVEGIENVSKYLGQLSSRLSEVTRQNIQLSQLTGTTGKEMMRLKSGVQVLADYIGEDYNRTLIAANNLAQAFGISMDEALQLIKDGVVSGANANGEFIDTIKEYPRYFKEAGLSAEQFIAITTHAAQQGIYSDKGVDAIKEGNLRIREMTTATAAALDGIGISSTQVQQDLQSGATTTFEVMQRVAEQLKTLPASSAAVGTAIADIFGGPGEDAGLEYIKTLADVKTNMSEVKDAAGEVAIQMDKMISRQQGFKNLFNFDLTKIYAIAQPFIDLAAKLGVVALGITSVVRGFQAAIPVIVMFTNRIKGLSIVSRVASSLKALDAVSLKIAASFRMGAVAANVFRIAIRGLLISSGVGILIWGVTAAINALAGASDKAKEKMQDLKDAEQDFTTAAANAKVEMDNEISKLKQLIESKADATEAVNTLNEKYGDIFGTFQTASDWYDTLTQKSSAYAKMVGYEAQARVLASKIAEKEIQREMAAQKMREMEQAGTAVISFKTEGLSSIFVKEVEVESDAYKAAKKEVAGYDEELKGLNDTMAVTQRLLKETAQAAGVNPITTTTTTPATTPTTSADPKDNLVEGSLAWYEAKIANLRKQIWSTVDEAAARELSGQLQQVEQEYKGKKIELGLEPKIEEEQVQKKVDDLSITLPVRPEVIQRGTADDLRQSYSNAQSIAGTIRNDYEIGLIGKEEAERQIAGLNAQLTALGLNKIELELDTAQLEESVDAMTRVGQTWNGIKGVGSGIEGITSALKGNGSAWQAVTGIIDGFLSIYQGIQSVIEIINAMTTATNLLTVAKQGETMANEANTQSVVKGAAQEIAASVAVQAAKRGETTAGVASAAAGALSAHASIPFVGIALGLAAVGAIIAAMASLPKFAKGGVVSGPTLALVGEYAGAGGNPEVIAPLDKLRGMLGRPEGSDYSKVQFEIKGRRLVGILNKENDIRSRN